MEFNVAVRPARTGIYYANSFFKPSTPVDLLCFKPLATIDRPTPSRPACFAGSAGKTLARAGAAERSGSAPVAAGTRSTASFGSRSSAASSGLREQISAVWFWSKLKLRGGRGKGRAKSVGILPLRL
jgi:hypothetical protein